ncbi:MAG: L,D-transpeptidase family protein [Thermodesulfobacteriota bacterium]
MKRTSWALGLLLLFQAAEALGTGAYRYELPSQNVPPRNWDTVIGVIRGHTVEEGETLLDVARNYGLGFNEMEILYPNLDPWIPRAGTRLLIPTQWVLPPTTKQGIVINVPEMRLYLFYPKTRMVRTYPIGIGDVDFETPLGTYKVVSRQVNPGWTVPKSLRQKYGMAFMPPGPDNPLGKHWLGLSRKGYGIHGTDFAWSVGRLVTHGCIRLYPEQMEHLFGEVAVNTPVEIVYEPVKVGFKRGDIYLEVHPDPYRKVKDLQEHTRRLLTKMGLSGMVSRNAVETAVEHKDGVPVKVGSVDQGRPVFVPVQNTPASAGRARSGG